MGRSVFVLAFVVLAVGFLVPWGAGAARLFTSGFETNNLTETEWNVVNGSPTIATTLVHSGTYALRLLQPAATTLVDRQLPAAVTSGTYFHRFYFRLAAFPSGGTKSMFVIDNLSDSTSAQVQLRDSGGGNFRVRLRNGATGGSTDSTFNLALDTWYRIELRHLIDDTAGDLELKLYIGDSTTEEFTLSQTGVDTLSVSVQRFRYGFLTDTAVDLFLDDIAINDDTGSFQNSWPGAGRIVLLEPTFDDSVAWTANPSGSNAANVNDEPGLPDGDTTRNEVSDTTSEDKFFMSELPDDVPVGATLTLAHVFARAGGDGASARSIRLRWWNEEGTAITGPQFDTSLDGYRIGDTDELLVVDLSTSTRVDVSVSEIGYVANTGSSLLKKVTALWANVEWSVGAAGGASVSSRSDTMSDSRPSVGSNHTIQFTINTAIDTSETVEVTWPSGFLFSEDELNCGDVDVATGSEFVLSATSIGCEATATQWGVTFVTSSRTFILVAPTSTRVWVATGTQMTIEIGTNATSQFAGNTRITNPSLGGTYTVSVGGTFGGAGNMLIAIISGLTVEAQVAEHLTVAITGVPNWYNTSWGFRKRIIVDSTSVSGTQGHVDFPMLFNSTRPDFRHTDNGGNVGSVTGFDFVFTSSDGTTKLDHEIERYASTTGELVAWTRIPFLSTTSTNELFVYYGYAAASDQQNITGVWDVNFAGVWHLTTTSTNTTLTFDSTVNSNTGTKLTATEPTSTSTGQINGAQDFDGSNDYIRANDSSSLDVPSSFTLSTWFNLSAYPSNNEVAMMIAKGEAGETSDVNHNYYFLYNNNLNFGDLTVDDGLQGGFEDSSGTNYQTGSTMSISLGTWYHGVLVFDDAANTVTIYLNGENASEASGQTGAPNTQNQNMTIGQFRDGTPVANETPFPGGLDDVRVSSSVRASAWILTEYNNQSSPQTFYTLGSEEAQAQTSCTADDGASVTVVNTTGASVPFGTVPADTFYQGCQDVEVSTNAGGGYVLTVQEDGPMRTGGGATIPDTNCDSGCDEITAGAWTGASNNGFGHTCRNQVNNDCNAEYANGTGFRRFPSVSGGTAGLAVKVATGSYTGDGSATSISHGLGTTPKVVMVWIDEDVESTGWVLRTNQHSGADSINFPTGSGNSRLASDMITALGSTTFSLGTASSVNQTSSSYQWIAYAGTGVVTGSYTGDGNDNRNIPHGIGTTPKMLFVWPDTDNNTTGFCSRSDRYTGDTSICWQLGANNTSRGVNKIQAMDGTNFQVGTDVNANGTSYKWFAFVGPSVGTGSYAGNGQDNRDIPHGLSATPSLTWVWRDQNGVTRFPVVRSNQYTGDVSLEFEGGAGDTDRSTNMIQAMSATTFQVGTFTEVNAGDANTYQWFAVKTSSTQSEKAGETLMASSTRVSIAVGRVKFRLSIGAGQGAGVYTNTIVYIVTPTY